MSAQDDKITLEQAISWTGAWRANPNTSARAFLIPVKDLQGVLGEIQNQSGTPMARAYLGMDGSTEKLIIVGTTQESDGKGGTIYRDMLPSTSNDVVDGEPGIWDFSEPCPPSCDDDSDLN